MLVSQQVCSTNQVTNPKAQRLFYTGFVTPLVLLCFSSVLPSLFLNRFHVETMTDLGVVCVPVTATTEELHGRLSVQILVSDCPGFKSWLYYLWPV